MKNEKRLIIDGVMQCIFPLRLCGRKDYEEYAKRLEQSTLVLTVTSGKEINLKNEFLDVCRNEFIDNVEEAVADFQQKNPAPFTYRVVRDEDAASDGTSFRLTMRDPLSTGAELHLGRLIHELNSGDKHHAFASIKRSVFLLQPVQADGNLLFVSLTLFENGMALLKLEYELNDEDIHSLSKRTLQYQYDKLKLPVCCAPFSEQLYGYYTVEQEGTEHDILHHYLMGISNIFHRDISYGDEYRILFMNDYTSLPSDIGSAGDDFRNDIIRLLCAPVTAVSEPSKQMQKQLYEDAHYEIGRYCHVFVSTAPCIIAARVGDITAAIEQMLAEEEREDADTSMLERSIIYGVTPAVEAVALKKLLQSEITLLCGNTESRSISKLLKAKEEIHKLTTLELSCFRFYYDTMTKLAEFIDERISFRISGSQATRLLDSFNDTVSTRKNISNERSNMLLTAIGTLLAVILSFIGIRDIVEYVNKRFAFVPESDTASLFRVTMLIWVIVVVLLVVSYFVHRFRIKRK